MMKVAAVLKEEGGSQPLQCSISLFLPCCPDLGQLLNALGSFSWTPCAASSCWEALLLRTRSSGRSPRRMPTRRYLWSWCTVCCQSTDSWPGAEWSPSPFPGRGLKTTSTHEWKISKVPRAAALKAAGGSEHHEGRVDLKYLAAPAVRFAASGRRYPAGACGFFASYTGCIL